MKELIRKIEERISLTSKKIDEKNMEIEALNSVVSSYKEVLKMINDEIKSAENWDKRKLEILQKLNSGEYRLDGRHQRKPGTRPESLKNIRNAHKERKSDS